MITYKKVTNRFQEYILTLEVVGEYVACGSAIRAERVFVKSAETKSGRPVEGNRFFSLYDWNFEYRVGQIAESDLKATKGIYCFTDKALAVAFMAR